MTCLGFTEKMLALAEGDGPTPGDEVAGNEQIAALPEGTLLYWAFRTGGNAVYVRDDSARNMAKTRRVWGHDDSEQNSHTRMVVAKLPGEEESFMHWRVVGRVLDRMPTGVRYLNASGVERTLGDGHPVSIYDSYTVVDWAVF
jgi:hypothetical protein